MIKTSVALSLSKNLDCFGQFFEPRLLHVSAASWVRRFGGSPLQYPEKNGANFWQRRYGCLKFRLCPQIAPKCGLSGPNIVFLVDIFDYRKSVDPRQCHVPCVLWRCVSGRMEIAASAIQARSFDIKRPKINGLKVQAAECLPRDQRACHCYCYCCYCSTL